MGVKQLTSYVNEHYAIFYADQVNLRGLKLVFDGGCLYYGLIRNSNVRFGGNYNILYAEFEAYFLKLKSHGIMPYVVLDGGANIPIKNNTICERYEKNVKALKHLSNFNVSTRDLPKPKFVKAVLIEVMNDLGINFVLTKGEADMLTASLANRLDCPVATSDSDFFIMDVTNGVLPINPILKLNSTTRKCERFRSTNLARHLKMEEKLLPMIAVIMGNDYSEQNLLEQIQKNSGVRNSNGTLMQLTERVNRIGAYLRQFGTMEEAIANLSGGDDNLLYHIKYELDEFDFKPFQDHCNELYPILSGCRKVAEKMSPLMQMDMTIEKYLTHACYHGLGNPCMINIYFHSTHFIRTQSENIAQKASEEASEKLRSYLYVLLNAEKAVGGEVKVNEFKRIGDRYRETKICLSMEEWAQYYPLDILTGTYGKAEKAAILCKITSFPTENLPSIGEQHHLFLLSINYWIHESSLSTAKLNIEFVQALMICYVQLIASKEINTEQHSLDPVVSHHYCRWQSILFYLDLLNIVFRYPFPALRFSTAFNGSRAHHLYHALDRGANPYDILLWRDHELYDALMKIVIGGDHSRVLVKQQNRPRKRERTEGRGHANFVPPSNRYAMLNSRGI